MTNAGEKWEGVTKGREIIEPDDQPELYLILHKVRGEPAFDIAQKLTIGDEEGWIIPTSGHRAYPYWSERLYAQELIKVAMPEDWPDHYNTFASREPSIIATTARDLLRKIGLAHSAAPIKRRKVG